MLSRNATMESVSHDTFCIHKNTPVTQKGIAVIPKYLEVLSALLFWGGEKLCYSNNRAAPSDPPLQMCLSLVFTSQPCRVQSIWCLVTERRSNDRSQIQHPPGEFHFWVFSHNTLFICDRFLRESISNPLSRSERWSRDYEGKCSLFRGRGGGKNKTLE